MNIGTNSATLTWWLTFAIVLVTVVMLFTILVAVRNWRRRQANFTLPNKLALAQLSLMWLLLVLMRYAEATQTGGVLAVVRIAFIVCLAGMSLITFTVLAIVAIRGPGRR